MDIKKRMELKGSAVQPTDKKPWHNTCGDMTARLELLTAVFLKIEVFWGLLLNVDC
jgi:hypothetical protein